MYSVFRFGDRKLTPVRTSNQKTEKMKIFFTTTNVLRSILLGKTERYRTERLRSDVKETTYLQYLQF